VTPPEFAIQIIIAVIAIRTMEVNKVPAKKAGHETNTPIW
jgi:hypothetical protein